ncbi:MAG: phosphotransferase family protein [Nocardioides sp.]|nr:phosphotransferase family protein [Nocardioides sp.]
MDDQGIAADTPLSDVRPIGGGTQNVMIRFRRGPEEFVFRRGPEHVRATTNDALLREMRILRGLSHTSVPHPRLLAASSDPGVLGDSVFYLMAPVDGFNAVNELPTSHRESATVRREMGLRQVDALRTLHEVVPEDIGLGDLGRPYGFHERQVPRWMRELESYNALPGYEGHAIPGLDEVARWLSDRLPRSWRPGLMHGDFHLSNVMFEPAGPEVAAIVDWEMCTVGDPLLDLGWMLSLWADPGARSDLLGSELAKAGDLATPDDLIQHYAAAGSRSLDHIDWYRVLACFKLGIVLEGTYARSRAGKAAQELGAWMHERTTLLFERAHTLIAASDL